MSANFNNKISAMKNALALWKFLWDRGEEPTTERMREIIKQLSEVADIFLEYMEVEEGTEPMSPKQEGFVKDLLAQAGLSNTKTDHIVSKLDKKTASIVIDILTEIINAQRQARNANQIRKPYGG